MGRRRSGSFIATEKRGRELRSAGLARWSVMDHRAEYARQLDAADPLTGFRERFHLPAGLIYLDGNSLGLLSRDAESAVLRVLAEWKTQAIGGWLEGTPPWFTLAERLAGRVATLIGAAADEVAIANSTTVNLHQLLATLYRVGIGAGGRTKILVFDGEFPSDLYAVQSHLRLRGLDPAGHLVLWPAGADSLIDEASLGRRLREDATLQMVVLPAVVYTTGQLLDLKSLTAAGHEAGLTVGFDLAHSVGVVPHELSGEGVDFAFWCHYKYLNAGPGALGGLYLNRRHFERAPGLAGWWGSHKETMFDMAREMRPAGDAGGLQVGTPPVLSLAALEGALQPTVEAGIERLRKKSLAMTRYLMELASACLPGGVRFGNPPEDGRRGGHVALVHPEAWRICRALRDVGIVTDYRMPDIVRLAPVPLYNTFLECHQTISRLREVLEQKTFERFPAERALVP